MCSDCVISSISSAQQSAVASKIGYSVYATQLQATKQVGEAMVDMLDQVAQLSKELGKGENFDKMG